MNYNDENGSSQALTEFAEAACKVGYNTWVPSNDWEQKETELKAKSIDCIWTA